MQKHCHAHVHCKMKGFLSFLILWLLSKQDMTGVEITEELEKRKGHRPSPGTIYPVLGKLKELGLIIDDDQKRYSLTKNGREELQTQIQTFFETFCDIDDMKNHYKINKH